MISEHIHMLTEALIAEFYRLYERYSDDGIYACALVFTPYLIIDDLAISTTRSLFCDEDENIQYLSEHDKWQVHKWRYRSHPTDNQLTPLKHTFSQYFNQTHIFGQPSYNEEIGTTQNNLDIFLKAFAQAKIALTEAYGLDIESTVFFISIPKQAKIEIASAQKLNKRTPLLSELMLHKYYQPQLRKLNDASAKIKLNQSDRDLLIDLAQILFMEPYDYLNVAREVYLLTLEPHFIDANTYIQKLVQNIAAMDAQVDGSCAISREELILQIQKTSGIPISLPKQPNSWP
jgi:hypothetical protein